MPLLPAAAEEVLFTHYFGRQLFVHRGTPATLAAQDALLSLDLAAVLQSLVAQNCSACVTVRNHGEHLADARLAAPSPAALSAVLADGLSVVLNVELAPTVAQVPVLGPLLRDVSARFALEASLHVYATPANAQALNPHNDPYDIVVVQVSGAKHWTLCSPAAATLPAAERSLFFSAADLCIWQTRGGCKSCPCRPISP